jgi:hypothetical protein
MRNKQPKEKLTKEQRDSWQTPPDIVNIVRRLLPDAYDACCTDENAKFPRLPGSQEVAQLFMNPPFSKACEMFNTYLPQAKEWVVCYRADNMETSRWRTLKQLGASWIWIPDHRIQFLHPVTGVPICVPFVSCLVGNTLPLRAPLPSGTILEIIR